MGTIKIAAGCKGGPTGAKKYHVKKWMVFILLVQMFVMPMSAQQGLDKKDIVSVMKRVAD